MSSSSHHYYYKDSMKDISVPGIKWVLLLFLLFSYCKKRDRIIEEYVNLTEEEIQCIVTNVTPLDKESVRENEDFKINGKYYSADDPHLIECIKHLVKE